MLYIKSILNTYVIYKKYILIRRLVGVFILEFIQAYLYTGYFRACILIKKFSEIKEKMGVIKTESQYEIDEEIYAEAKRISYLINKVSRYTLWESKCLVQALTAQKLLNKKGMPSTLYLGVCKNNNGEMLAHAWIRCGQYYVTGGLNYKEFTVVAKFSN